MVSKIKKNLIKNTAKKNKQKTIKWCDQRHAIAIIARFCGREKSIYSRNK